MTHADSEWSPLSRDELAIALSYYELGVVSEIRDFRKGSRRAPKVRIKTDRGLFLLKRRAPGRDDAERIAFTHELQRRLTHSKYPLPRLIPTREGKTIVHINERYYEAYEFIRGTPFDQGLQTTYQSGQALAAFHRILKEFKPAWEPSAGHYHNAPVAAHLGVVPEKSQRLELRATVEYLREAYMEAATTVRQHGIDQWPRQIIHGDWHPGNMLYQGPQVVAVIDYDTARRGQRILDVANGALQFSVTRNDEDPSKWPDALDESRLKRFCRGYDSVKGCVISTAELAVLPHLMIEALIVEAAIPIATTGHFAGIEGGAFLQMVERKVRWLQDRVDHIPEMLA